MDPVLEEDNDFGDEKSIDENESGLLDVLRPGIDKIDYEYDFGDCWRHSLLIERIEPDGAGFQGYAMCIAGERACPPEDCGGTPGFESFLTIIKDPNDEEYESMIEWVGKKYNPAAFNIEKTNRYLKKLKWDHPSIDQLGGILAARDGYKE